MSYEINIAKRYRDYTGKERYGHYFATSDRSLETKEKMQEVLTDLREAFPEPEFQISVSKQVRYWQTVNIDEIDEEQNHE